MDVASALNEDVVTDFPVLDAVGKLEPGVYVIAARPWKGSAKSPPDSDLGESVQLAAQWMVVSRPWSDRGFRRRRGARNRAVAGLRRAARRRRAQAHRAQQRSAGDKDDRRRGPCRFRSWLVARQRRLSAWPSGRHACRRLRLLEPRSECLRPQRPRRRGPRSAQRAGCLPLHRARRLSLRRNRVRRGAFARLQGRREIRPAPDPGRQAAGRVEYRRATVPDAGSRRAIVRDPAAARIGGWKMDDRGLRRSQGRQHRPGRIPA